MNTNRSANYLKSIVNDQSAKDEILKVRAAARIFNLEQKLAQAKDPAHVRLVKKVDVYGRLGKNNPAALEYRHLAAKQRANFTFGAQAYQRIAIKDAATVDIYVSCTSHESCARSCVVDLTTGAHEWV
jgi:hypothetical protein